MKTILSDQALGAVMLALQKSLMEQSDIVPVLKGMNFEVDDSGELVVVNPPDIDLSKVEFKEEQACPVIHINALSVIESLKHFI